MLSLALFTALFVAIHLVYGRAVLQAASRQPPVGLAVPFLTGLAVTTAFASALSLVLPLNEAALMLIALPALGLGAWQARRKQMSLPGIAPLTAAMSGLFLFAVLHNAVLPVSNFDTGLYHAQAIQWLNKFPAVPGLANLHGRFGFNSNWFVANAWGNLASLRLAEFHPATAATFAALLGGMLITLPKIGWNGPERVGRIFGILLIPAAFYTLSSEISSPGTDLPAALLTWACVWLILTEPGRPQTWLALFITPIFAATIKLSTAPLLLLSLYALYKMGRAGQYPALRAALAAGAFLLIPWLARNIILTGYLVFPQTAFNIFTVDWKVPLDAVAEERDAVLAWARLPGEPIDYTLALPLTGWLPRWFDNLSRGQQVIIMAGALSPLAIGGYALRQPASRQKLLMAALTLTTGLIYWLLTAPAIRFGYGFILGLAVLAAACALDWLARQVSWVKTGLPSVLSTLVCAYLVFFLIQSFDRRTLSDFAVLPAPYPNLPTAPCQMSNATIFIGQEYQQCWNAPIPCAPYCNPNLALRGKTLKDGFYIP